MKVFLFSLVCLFAAGTSARAQAATDTLPGVLVKTITTSGEFVMFDKTDSARFFLRDASNEMTTNFVMTAPETDLFLADHAKDDLKLTYQVREVTKPDGNTERLNYILKLRSLKTGDDLSEWPKKLADNPDLLARNQKELQEIR